MNGHFAPLTNWTGVQGDGCPYGSLIDPTRGLCHTCRKETLGAIPDPSRHPETGESSRFVGLRDGAV